MSNNAHDLSNRLLNALDNNYNVVDMHAVNEIISILEKINITKELLETTRLGKHVNELRRKTTDPTLARRAKVLVKRWRDLVIPTRASPAHTGSNRSSAERQVRRLGGTPLTSPALSRVVSPAVASPRPPSRPTWGGYESDSQDVIVVDDDPAPPAPAPAPAPPAPAPAPPALATPPPLKPITSPAKRPVSPELVHDEKKAKRDKKPKKRRGHSRAGSGTETPAAGGPPHSPAGAAPAPAGWGARNGAHAHERRRNGCRKDAVDPYAALVKKIPQAGAKKVKTTKELLEQIQSRGVRGAAPASPRAPPSPDDDVVLVEDACPLLKVDSPLRNGTDPPSPAPCPPPRPPLEDPRQYHECTCGDELADDDCPAARKTEVLPYHIRALHHVYLPGINGTRAPTHPHQFAVRKLTDPDKPGLFTSVVPLFKYSDYADDYCVKNMSRVPICTHLPWTEFAPPPPDLPAPPSPPPLRPYPIDAPEVKQEVKEESEDSEEVENEVKIEYKCPIEAEMVSVPSLEPSERLKAPLLLTEDVKTFGAEVPVKMDVEDDFKSEQQDHRTVERTKEDIDGRTLYTLCERALESVPYVYNQTSSAPVVTLPQDDDAAEVLESALSRAEQETVMDDMGRPPRSETFTEWQECAQLGDLIALPYVVID